MLRSYFFQLSTATFFNFPWLLFFNALRLIFFAQFFIVDCSSTYLFFGDTTRYRDSDGRIVGTPRHAV